MEIPITRRVITDPEGGCPITAEDWKAAIELAENEKEGSKIESTYPGRV